MRDETGTASEGERRDARDGGDSRGGAGGGRFSDGLRNVNAVLSAFKEAVEESFNEARDRGDLSTEKARELVQGALTKARAAAGEAKERLDLVSQREFEELTARVEELRTRVQAVEDRLGGARPSGAGPASPPPDPPSAAE